MNGPEARAQNNSNTAVPLTGFSNSNTLTIGSTQAFKDKCQTLGQVAAAPISNLVGFRGEVWPVVLTKNRPAQIST